MKVILNFIQMCYQTLPSKLQRKFQSAIKQQDIFQQIKIEFSNGEVLNMNQQLPYNSIQIVSIYGFVNAVIWDFFHLENIILLVLLIIAFTNRYSSQDQIFILAFSLDCYVIQFLLSIIMTSWCHYQRWSYQNQINKKTCIVMSQIKRLALNDGFDDNSVYPYECIEWGKLQAGTIICVQRGEQCPADLLILDSSQEEIIINHKTRHPCQATFIPINSSQKGVMIDFKINLNGSIQFNQQTNQIQGTIKLKNDPKATQFNSNNILFRGEVLESTDWIYGMSLLVGSNCMNIMGSKKDNRPTRYNQYRRQFFIVSILLNIILIPKIIYDTKTDPFYSFFDYLIIVLALLPFQVYIVDQIFVLINSIRAYITYNSKATDHDKKYQLISQRGLNEYDLIQETDKQVIIGVNKHESSGNVIIRKKSSQIQETIINITGSLQFTNNSFTNLIHTDLVVVENPENIFRRLPKVSQIVIDNNRYNINYDRVRDQVLKTSPSLKQNCDKLLINTYRSHMYDEQKTNDFELLLNEKKTPSFVQQQLESNNQGSVLKPGFFRDKSFAPKKTQLEGQKQLNPYVSFRKQSARNLFNSTNNLAANSSGGENKQFQGSPRSTYRQKSFKKSMMGQKLSVSSQSQANAPLIKEQEYLSSDRLIGDIFSEQDFYEKLISKEDTKMNEILIMMLICNDVSSYYDIHTKVIKNTYPNIYDKSIIDFAALFDYVFFHSAHVEINKPEYSTNQIIKRTISIQGIVKIFEILFILKPTEKRPKTISVLVRDPESFHLEEGALLYTRYETNMIVDQKISQINVGQINDILHEMQWDGLQTFVYTKKQLTNEETRKIIDKMNQINDNYGYKSHEIEQFYLEQENDAQLVYLLGLKQVYKAKNTMLMYSNDLLFDPLQKDKFFNTMHDNNIKQCIMTQLDLEDLYIFLRNYMNVSNQENLLILNEQDVQGLKFKIRSYITYMIEEQQIFTSEFYHHASKHIIISSQAFDVIRSDDYLKYHFLFIINYAIGISAYKFNAKQKGQLIKMMRNTFKSIVGLGKSLDNSQLFHYCDYSFGLQAQDIQVVVSKPNFIILKLMEFVKAMFYQCPEQLKKRTNIYQNLIYKYILIGLTYFYIQFDFQYEIIFNLIFYHIISNIITYIITYKQFRVKNEFDLNDIKTNQANFLILRSQNMLIKTLKTILISITDSLIILCAYRMNLELHIDGRNTDENQIVMLFINLELIEKLRIFFELKFLNLKDLVKKFIVLIIIITSIIVMFQILIVNVYLLDMNTQYHPENVAYVFFNLMLIIPLKYVLNLTLRYLDIRIKVDFARKRDYLNPQVKVMASKLPMIMDRVSDQKKVSVQKFINNTFKNKDIIDDQLIKALVGNDVFTVDKMESDLRFADQKAEKDYLLFLSEQKNIKFTQLTALIFYELLCMAIKLFFILDYQFIQSLLIILFIQLFIQSLLILFGVFLRITKENKSIILLSSLVFRYAFHFLQQILSYIHFESNVTFISSVIYCFAVCLTFQSKLGLVMFFTFVIINFTVEILLISFQMNFESYENWYIATKSVCIVLQLLHSMFEYVYKNEYLLRYSYILQNQLLLSQKKLNDVLGLLMPRFIKERMTKGQISISEDQGDVSILFCDICEFDDIIKCQNENIVNFLDNLFRQFDQLCQSNDVQKIETVGKTYMAAAGLKDYDIIMNQTHFNSTQRVLETAIGMIESVRNSKYGNNKDITLKIGIHYGRVIAGVIGAHKPQFSLIGDTVNTTSRVCSTGDYGFITLSEQAYLKVQNLKYKFVEKEVMAKGKGLIKTYKLQMMKKRELSMTPINPELKKEDDEPIISPQSNDPPGQPKKLSKDQKIKRMQVIDSKFSPKVMIRELRAAHLQLMENPNLKKGSNVEEKVIDLEKIEEKGSGPLEKQRSKSRSVYGQSQQHIQDYQQIESRAIIDIAKADDVVDPPYRRGNSKQRGSVLEFGIKRAVMRKQTTRPVIQQEEQANFDTQTQPNQFDKPQNTVYQRSAYKMHNSIKINESLSVIQKQSPKKRNQSRIDEIEIPKSQQILATQDKLKSSFISQLLKYKVDSYQSIEFHGLQYQTQDHHLYHTIYDQYKDYTHFQLKKTFLSLTLFIFVINLLQFIIGQKLQNISIQYILISIAQALVCGALGIIGIKMGAKDDERVIKYILYGFFLVFSITCTVQLSYTTQEYQTILHCGAITAVYVKTIQQQILNKDDTYKIHVIFILQQILIMVFGQFWVAILFFTIGVLAIVQYIQNQSNQYLVKNYETSQLLETQKQKQDTILQHLLPTHILNKFMSDQANIENFTDVFEDATILFADIAGFTKYSSSVQPEQVVTMLRKLFMDFDKFCQDLNVYKLYTIGDCYVCMGIIDNNNRDPVEEALNVTLFGVKMIDVINTIRKNPEFQHLNMRIGVHTGKIIGGVAGTDVVRYDIYGEDVTIANKMESNGTEGKMMVSEATKELLESTNYEDMFIFEFSKSVFIPSRNQSINGYFVEYDNTQYD